MNIAPETTTDAVRRFEELGKAARRSRPPPGVR